MQQIELACRPGVDDPEARAAAAELAAAGLQIAEPPLRLRLVLLQGQGSETWAPRLARELLVDPLLDDWAVNQPIRATNGTALTIRPRPGVMDPLAQTLCEGARTLGWEPTDVQTALRWLFPRLLDRRELELAARTLANQTVQAVETAAGPLHPWTHARQPVETRREVPLRAAAPDELVVLSRRGGLSLNLQEMSAIQAHYRNLGREPTSVELETLAQTWSEHCKHKTLTSACELEHTERSGRTRRRSYGNLLKDTIFAATRALAHPFCVSVFSDNAGVVRFAQAPDGDDWCLSLKVETHNHPSAIEPYGGAGTGVGGVIRDTLGTGLGARPIAGTDVFCLAPPDTPASALPPGVLPPRRVLAGVIAGVRDYGNRMGIPTVAGALSFQSGYLANPLVFCGSLGLLRASQVAKEVRPGDRIFLLGGRTGRDGIHGATLSSIELGSGEETMGGQAVQIGDPVTEKKLLDVLLQARDRRLYRAITDCGAGGLSSAVGEMAQGGGAGVELERVPLKYAGLSAAEIWISEAQERMVLAVPPERADELAALCAAEDVEATDLGAFDDTGTLVLRYAGQEVGGLELDFLHDGLPRAPRRARWRDAEPRPTGELPSLEPARLLPVLLASPELCSRAFIVRQYDHEVQGATAIKPLVGRGQGHGDGAVLRPVAGSSRGVALGHGLCPRLADLNGYDPYAMAAAALDEAVRNVVALGADPAHIALLDNFCWGDVSTEEGLGALARAAESCHDLALTYGMPFISGKDSLNNVHRADGIQRQIPGTLLITALGIVPDAERAVSADLKRAGDRLFLLGRTDPELGGSFYLEHIGRAGTGEAPRLRPAEALARYRALHQAIAEGLVAACHDLSDGGLLVALAEMALAGELGLEVDVGPLGPEPHLALAETPSRFLVEVAPEHESVFLERLEADPDPPLLLGVVQSEPVLALAGPAPARMDLARLRSAFEGGVGL